MATSTLDRVERKGMVIRWRYVIAFAILIPLLAHLVYALAESRLTNYYVTVDELLARGPHAKGARVGAPIVPGSINWNNAARSLTFQLQGEGQVLTVNYRGWAPDSFRDGAMAIAEGELNQDGTFQASQILVKCPHQYIPGI